MKKEKQRKSAFWKDVNREIKNTKNRFFCIFLIVALGVAFFAGIRATEPDMQLSADKFFDETNMMDVRIVSTMGLTDGDIEAVKKLGGVKDVEGNHTMDALWPVGDREYVIRVMKVPETINKASLQDGRMPVSPKECVIDSRLTDFFGKVKIGDEIHLISGEDGELSERLANTEFEVVGVVTSPLYLSFERDTSSIGKGSVDGFIMVDDGNFLLDYYTDIYVTANDGLALVSYSEDYQDMGSAFVDEIETISDERVDIRFAEIKDEAQEKIDEAQEKLDEETAEANEKLDDAAAKIADAKNQIEDAKLDIEDAKTRIEDGKKDLEDGEKEINENALKLGDGWQQYDDAYAEYEKSVKLLGEKKEELEKTKGDLNEKLDAAKAAKSELVAKKKELKALKSEQKDKLSEVKAQRKELVSQAKLFEQAYGQKNPELEAGIAAADEGITALKAAIGEIDAGLEAVEAGITEAESGIAQLKEALSQVAEGEKEIKKNEKELEKAKVTLDATCDELIEHREELAKARTDLEDGKVKISDAETDVEKGEKDLEEGEKTLADNEAEYNDKRAEADEKIADANRELDDARQKVADLKKGQWYVLDRDYVRICAEYGENSNRIGAIGKVFPIIFFLVAILVSLTTMTRMVEEERTQIGTLKALGYSKNKIALKYLLYALYASLSGAAVGAVVGQLILPYVIVTAYRIIYQNLPYVLTPFHADLGIIAGLVACACTVGAAYAACRKSVAQTAAGLMRPTSPKAGKRVFIERIGFIWKSLNFTQKSTVRNLFRYKKRLLMTVFGIAGCMGLLIVGLGLHDSIFAIIDNQYGVIMRYNGMLTIAEDAEEEDYDEVFAAMEKSGNIDEYVRVCRGTFDAGCDGVEKSAYTIVPEETENFSDYITLRDRVTKKPYKLEGEGNGVIISEKLGNLLDVGVGDEFYLKNADNERFSVTVAHITENYIYNFVYFTADQYERVFGEAPEFNDMFFNEKQTDEASEEELAKTVLSAPAVKEVSFTTGFADSVHDVLSSLDFVVAVLVVSAALLAFVVLYNLNNININERKRELATLKVLGFYDTEVSGYVFRENVLLTVMGTALGLVFGFFLHRYVILTAEIDLTFFGREIKFMSYVYAVILTFLFSLFVNFVMHFKLKKINMVESLKSIE